MTTASRSRAEPDLRPRDLGLGGDGATTPELARLRTATETLLTRNAQLEHALESRIVIEQAKGVLAERFGIEVGDAFELIRAAARSNRMRVRDLSAAIVASRETPRQIKAALAQRTVER